ncbi:MAG: hypothetical protein JO165_10385 [Candidatus Eremiobacteraeota bacterium]|nr:hypothetical protein [Candidatus Eremiobacteraeota bacterium]
MSQTIAAIGFKVHTGWATFVAMGRALDSLKVSTRGRAELLPPDKSIPRFVYHEASQMSDARAADLVARAVRASHACASTAISDIIEDLRSNNIAVRTCAVITGASEAKTGLGLEAILKSHALIHASEGRLFRDAIVNACFERALEVLAVPERDAWARAATAWKCSEDALRGRIGALRATVGPPWGADEKAAAAAALVALFPKRGITSHRVGKEPICP